jgi:GAF domain-containing protein
VPSRIRRVVGRMSARRKYRLAARGVFVVLGASAVYLLAALIQEKQYGWALAPAALLALVGLGEFVATDVILDARFSQETSMLLARLEDRLANTSINEEIVKALNDCIASFVGCDPTRISSTSHLRIEVIEEERPVPALVQITKYTNRTLGGQPWRITNATKGLIGRCLRLERKVWVNFRTAEEYRERMVGEFGYRREEADEHTKAARSYLAVPIGPPGRTIGILFFQSTEPQVFPIAADDERLNDCAEKVWSLLRATGVLNAEMCANSQVAERAP